MKTPLTSHRHGEGQHARWAWGDRKDCATCTAADARMEAGRKWMQGVLEEEQDKFVNTVIAKDERPSFGAALERAALKAFALGLLFAAGAFFMVAVLSDSPNTPMHVARVK